MKRYPTHLKVLLLCICTAISVVVGTLSYESKLQQMTDWQRQQTIDFDKQTGSTKFKAIIDSATNGSIAFCISAIALIASYKFYNRNRI